MTVIIYRDDEGMWRWRAKRKGRITADSGEGYANKANAQRAASAFLWAAEAFVIQGKEFVYE